MQDMRHPDCQPPRPCQKNETKQKQNKKLVCVFEKNIRDAESGAGSLWAFGVRGKKEQGEASGKLRNRSITMFCHPS